jgi:tetratricopeptide (TPR) repeat protein
MKGAPGRHRSVRVAALCAILGASVVVPLDYGDGGVSLVGPSARAGDDPALRLRRGRELLGAGDAIKAQREFESLIADAPTNSEAHAALVLCLLDQKNIDGALAAARTAVDASAGHALAHWSLGRALLAKGDFIAAAAAADRSMTAVGGPLAEGYRLKADAETLGGDAVAGEKSLRVGLENPSLKSRVLFELGDYLATQGRHADAEAPLREAAALAPNFLQAQVKLSRVLVVLKKIADARVAAMAALDADANHPEGYAALGRTFEAEGDFNASLPQYEQAAKLGSRKAVYHVDLGYAYGRLARFKEAEASLKAALKLDPDHREARFHLGWLYNTTGKPANALTEYQAILKQSPKDERALWYAADISVLQGKPKDAEGYLETLLKVNPKHSEGHRLMAEMVYNQGKIPAAQESIVKALEADPKNSRALLLRGRIEEDQEKYEDAEKSYLAGLEAKPDDLWVHLWIAELYEEVLDKPENALKHYKRYVELGGPDKDGEFARRIAALEE